MKSKTGMIGIILLIIFAAGSFWIYSSRTSVMQSSEKAVYYCPMHTYYTSDKPGNCPICGMKLVKREDESSPLPESKAAASAGAETEPKVFTMEEFLKLKPHEVCLLHKCKMGNCMMVITPEMVKLGKCPHCGEDLNIIIKELMPSGYSNIKLTSEKQQMIGIKTELVKKINLTKTIRTVGRIAYDPELYQTEEEFIQAAQALKKAETGHLEEVKEQASKLVDSSRLKLKLMGLSDDLIQEVENAGKPDKSLLYSEPGGKVWVYAPIYEYELPLIKTGDSIEAEVSANPGQKYHGTIRSIDPVLDPMTRSVRARAVLDNADGALKPEMYVNVTLQAGLGEVLAVPEEAVFATGEKNIIFVEKKDGFFEPREVITGASSEGHRQIKSGLNEGEEVVVSGNFLIDSESRLKGALEGVSGGEHQHGQ